MVQGEVGDVCLIALTGRQAARLVLESVSGLGVVVHVLNVPVIGVLDTGRLARVLSRDREFRELLEGCGKTVVIVPGTVEGSLEPVEEVLGGREDVRVVRGPRHPGELGLFVSGLLRRSLGGGGGPRTVVFAGRRIGLRGPPVRIVGEVHPETGDPVGLAVRLAGGADFLMAGADPRWGMERYLSRMRAVLGVAVDRGLGVVFEAPSCRHLDALAGEGLLDRDDVAATLPGGFWECSSLPRYGVVHPDPRLTGVEERLGYLEEAVGRAGELGLTVVADPVLGLPLLGFVESLEGFRRAGSLGVPLLLSGANVYEELPVDSFGVILLLGVIAVELGVSLFHVTEASWKSLWAAREAAYAMDLVGEAWRLRSTPLGVGRSMCLVKRSGGPPGLDEGLGGVDRVWVDRVEPVLDRELYFRVGVDWGRREIVVGVYRVGGGVLRVYSGVDGLSLLRRVARDFPGVVGEHLGYLGFELGRAEEALRSGGVYVQDEPLLEPPWCGGWCG